MQQLQAVTKHPQNEAAGRERSKVHRHEWARPIGSESGEKKLHLDQKNKSWSAF